jgi:endo-1,4-beta-D-glucanase Y
MFSGLWQWSKDHLRYRAEDKLLSWKWALQPSGEYALTDSNTVCDADQLVAFALYRADERWPGKGYAKEAETHARDWWRQCIFENNGRLYSDSSADGSRDIRLMNPGYFRPEAYRYLAHKLPDLPLQRLVDDGYAFLDRVYAQYGTMPDWTILGVDGSLQPAGQFVANTDTLGYDALQLIPNLAEDYAISKDTRAKVLLLALNGPVLKFIDASNSPPATVAHLLIRQSVQQSTTNALQRQYEQTVHALYKPGKGYWKNGANYRDQVWMWQWHYVQDILPADQKVLLK